MTESLAQAPAGAATSRTGADLAPTIAPGKPVMVTAPALPDMAAAREWLAARRDALRSLMLVHGHFFLRGLPVASSEDFAVVRDALLAERAQYKEKATPRSSYGNDIFSSTDLPAIQAIRLHNENSYTLDFPGVLAFACLEAPHSGGATTIADVRRVLAAIPPTLAARFRKHGWLLARNYNQHISLPWTAAFGTEDRAHVQAYGEQQRVAIRWKPDDSLATTQRRPAVITHPVTNEEVWFNHVAFWNSASLDEDVREVLIDTYGADGLPFETYLGDGQPLTPDEVRQLNDAYDLATCRESWRPGDVMFVDNILCAHGRDAFEGPRRVVVAMGEPVSLSDCRPSPPPSID